jgi:peptide/nickel transport system substrate-binding protein
LAEPGLPDGFHPSLHVPADRYIRGLETERAVAQVWTRIGVRTTVENMPWATFSGRAIVREFAISILARGNGTGEAPYTLVYVLGTHDPSAGCGSSNWGRYANPEVDCLLEAAVRELEDARREAILQVSERVVMGRLASFPCFTTASSGPHGAVPPYRPWSPTRPRR